MEKESFHFVPLVGHGEDGYWVGTYGYQLKLKPCRRSRDSSSHALRIRSSTLVVLVTPPYAARARVLISSSDLEMLSISDQGRVYSNSFMGMDAYLVNGICGSPFT